MTVQPKPEKIVGVDSLEVKITKPMTIDFGIIEFNKLTLMTGMNGAGKSLLLVYSYVLTEIVTLVLEELAPENIKIGAQFIMDKCFTKIDTTGVISGNFGESKITLTMEEGQILSVEATGFEDVTDVRKIKYMSSSMRTFESIKAYLRLRRVALDKLGSYENMATEMLDAYKLYDFKYMEMLIASMPFEHPMLIDSLKGFGMEDRVTAIDVDLTECDFFALYEDGSKKYMTSFGKGHQSIFNMTMGQLI